MEMKETFLVLHAISVPLLIKLDNIVAFASQGSG
jgi:hypothetical protein